MKTAFGVFLILHALVHVAWLAPKPDDPAYPFRLEGSSLLSGAPSANLRTLGLALAATALVAVGLAGLGVLGVPGLVSTWRVAAVVGAAASIVLMVVFWDKYFVVGPVLDVAVIVAALANWP